MELKVEIKNKNKDVFNVLIDDEDYSRIKDYKLTVENKATNKRVRINVEGKLLLLHRFILNVNNDDECKIVHLNKNILDNRKENLCKCTQKDATSYRKKHTNSKTEYKGVTKKINKFKSQITHNYKTYYLGSFKTEKEAALAYDKKALELFGKFANTNFLRSVKL